jgi:hypothetical protein
LYKKLKLNLEREFYLSYNNPDIRRGFTKIRIRDLEIEKGRYCKIRKKKTKKNEKKNNKTM